MNLFRKSPYRIRIDGHSVFTQMMTPITEWKPSESEKYLSDLQTAVKQTVDAPTWALISEPNPSSNPAYRTYVENIRKDLLTEFGLEDRREDVRIGTYHMGMLVLSFPAKSDIQYPYYYRGIQLKPMT